MSRSCAIRCGRVALMALTVLGPGVTAQRPSEPEFCPSGLSVCCIEATVTASDPTPWNGKPIAGAEVIAIPSSATLHALGWREVEGDPITLQGVAAAAIFSDGPPWWIVRDQPAPFAILARTDAKGHFHVDVTTIESSRPGPGEESPRLIVRAPGFATTDTRWSSIMPFGEQRKVIALEQEQVVHGQVVDADGHPVAQALVSAGSIGDGSASPAELARVLPPRLLPMTTSTDDDGRFVLHGARWSNGSILVAHAELGCSSARLDERTHPIDIDAGTVQLPRGVDVAGRVVDPVGDPVPCALVWSNPRRVRSYGICPEVPWQRGFDDGLALRWLLRSEDTLFARTDEQGNFILHGVRATAERGNPEVPTSVDVMAAAPGFDVARRLDVDLAGEERRDVTVRLQRESTIELSVLDGDSLAPVDDVHIRASPLMWPGGNASDFLEIEPTGPGVFVLHHAGHYETCAIVSAAGHAPVTLSISGLASGEHRRADVHLPPECVLSGQVTDSAGDAIPHARVSVMGSALRVASPVLNLGEFTTQTKEDGRWQMTGLPADLVDLAVQAGDMATVSIPELHLQPGERRTLDVKLQRAATLDVAWPEGVKSTSDRPFWVGIVRDPPTTPVWSGGPPQYGHTVFPHLNPGAYTVLCHACDPVHVSLGEGEHAQLALRGHRAPTVRGQVHCAGGAPDWVRVDARRAGGTDDDRVDGAEGQWVGADGRFEFSLPYAGIWKVSATQYQEGWSIGSQPVEVAWDGEAEVTIEVPDTRWYVRLADELGRALGDAQVRLSDEAGQYSARVSTDESGLFVVSRLPPGPYTLTCGFSQAQPASGGQRPLELPSPGRPDDAVIDVALPRRAAITGTVSGGVEQAAGTQVRLSRLDALDRAETRRKDRGVCVRVVDGRYEMAGLEAGCYRLRLESPTQPPESSSGMGRMGLIYWELASHDVVLSDNEQRVVDLHP
jgi:Carboxypeptidase regulatory-like domain